MGNFPYEILALNYIIKLEKRNKYLEEQNSKLRKIKRNSKKVDKEVIDGKRGR